MFCPVELAARIEGAERQMLLDACGNVRRRLPDLYCAPIAGGVAVATEPGSPLNKVAALGFQPFDESAWAAVEAEHARRQAPIQVELATLADPAIGKFLTGRGYRLVGVENVLGRPLAAADAAAEGPATAIRIAPCLAHELDTMIDVTVTGFLAADTQGVPSHESIEAFHRPVMERIIRDFAAAHGVASFLARIDGELAGASSMRLDDGIAQLSGAATLPRYRRRGVQSAFLTHRLAHAARAGCEIAVVTTQPGSKSQQNMHRAGFSLLYSRNVLRREV